jgi:hypothetical protein
MPKDASQFDLKGRTPDVNQGLVEEHSVENQKS